MSDTVVGEPLEDILPLVASGDESAVRACIDRYSGLVWSLARRHCRSTTEAEDAVQDVFVSIWRSAARFDPTRGSESTFIATITRRRLIDRVRRRSRGPDSITLDEAALGPRAATSGAGGPSFSLQDPSPGDSSDMGRISLREESDAAEQAMAMLSTEQQRVLRLSVVYGLSHEKIAQATDMPLGTVKTHIRRGLIKVRDVLRSQRNGASVSTGPDGAIDADRGVTQ